MADDKRVQVSLPAPVARQVDKLALLLTAQRGEIVQRPAAIEAAVAVHLIQLHAWEGENHATNRP